MTISVGIAVLPNPAVKDANDIVGVRRPGALQVEARRPQPRDGVSRPTSRADRRRAHDSAARQSAVHADRVFCRTGQRFVPFEGPMSLSRPPCFRRRSGCCCPRRSPPRSSGDHDPDQDASGPTPAPRAIAGKPVRFDRGWLTPFFAAAATRSRRSRSSAPRTGSAAEAGFAKAIEVAAARRRGAARGQYMVALARANLGKWNDAGQLFEELFKSYPKLAALPRLQRRPLPPAARRRGRRAGMGGAGRRRQRAEGGGGAGADRCAAHARTLERRARRAGELPAAVAERPAARRSPVQEGGGDGEGGRRRRRGDARKAAPDVTAIYRRVWAEAPHDGWGDRAAERLEQIAAALPQRRSGGACARAPPAS